MATSPSSTPNPSDPVPESLPSSKTDPTGGTPPYTTPPSPPPSPGPCRHRRLWIAVGLAVVVVLAALAWYRRSLRTVSTDDAYVNGHVTFVAPRVGGQVVAVLVDDNNRVHQGDLLVRLDPEPYQRLVDIAQASVSAAQADLVVAQAQARSLAAQLRSARFNLDNTMLDIGHQIALLRSKVAALKSRQAEYDNAKAEYERVQKVFAANASTPRELDNYKDLFLVTKAKVDEARQDIFQVRAGLGLPLQPEEGGDLAQVSADLDQNHAAVRQALARLFEAAAPLNVTDSYAKSPRQILADFFKRDPQGDIDRILTALVKDAPVVKQAQAHLLQAQRALDQATLNLSYCNVVAAIDGVVTRRNVNPGNNIIPGQTLMAVRSLTEIWIDANFKETQLTRLRIGQPVDIEVDMYGRAHYFKGRVSGFTMGTGSTLALLPPQNAIGNFVKVVQRLPVRIDLIDYHPDQTALFVGLSATPYIHVEETPTGPDAGAVLQPYHTPATTNPARDTQP